MRRTVLGVKCKATEWWRAERWGLHWNACATRCTFSGVLTVRGRPGGFLLTMDAVVLNCVTQFNIVWCVITFPFLLMSKCLRKTRCVAESLFFHSKRAMPFDQRCMMTEDFKPLYPAMCVSPRHLQRCRHGAKCKSSNCFSPTLYYPGICLEGPKIGTKTFCEKSRSAVRDLKPGPPEFERGLSRRSASEEGNRCTIFCMTVTVWLNWCNDTSQYTT